jgi:hypothetical protein
MNAPSHTRAWFWVTLLAVFVGVRQAVAQARYIPRYQEPQWLTMHLSEASAGVYAEGTYQDTTFEKTGTSVTHEHLFVGPALGFNLNGSIYHPNLIRYYINTEGAVGWAHDSFSGSTSARQDELQYLGRFAASVDILAGKPYHGSAFANYDHTFRDTDSFSRSVVDSWRYGAHLTYETGPWAFHADYLHRDEDVSSLSGDSTTRDDTLNFGASYDHKSGATTLSYTYDRYTRVDLGRVGDGTDHSIALAESDRFGSHEQLKLNANASFLQRNTENLSSEEILSDINLNAEHSTKLTSIYDVTLDRLSSEGFDSGNYAGQAALQHQLYDSLTSTFFVRGSWYDASDSHSDATTKRFGGGNVEAYTKQLSESSRIRISNSITVEHTDQDYLTTFENERHNFGENGPLQESFYLSGSDVIESSIVITDQQDSQPAYVVNLDYFVTRIGSRMLIERLAGSRIAVGATVLVDYRSEPRASGSYDSLTDNFQIRLDLWHNLVGLYGRVNLSQNNAAPELRIQDVSSYVLGGDFNWRALRLGGEYEIYDSTEAKYRATRLFQSLSFEPDQYSSISLDFTESWINYVDSHRQEEDYRFITRYHLALSHRLSLEADAGVALRRGAGVDQVLATVRPSIKYIIGKTTIDVGYDYEYELFLNNEERQKHMFLVRVKRMF